MVNPAFQRYVEAASGFTNLTAEKAERVVKNVVKSGAAATDQIGDLAEDLMKRQRRNRQALSKLVKTESERAVSAMGLATKREMRQLERQIDKLQRELDKALAASGSGATAKKSTAKKATAKKATAKKATAKKSTAKKAIAKQSTVKKSATKKATGAQQTSDSSAN